MAARIEVRVQIEVITLADARLDTLPSGLLTVVDAAACLGVSPAMLHAWIKTGQVNVVTQRPAPGRMGQRWLVPTEELRRVREADLFDDRRSSISRWDREEPRVQRLDPGEVLGQDAGGPNALVPRTSDPPPPT